ncbi:SET and MYND domain-containing protein 4 [Neocloeon triangulifer]|uniref:SET and MYND domain-containing protein 4 n=1 Tax=Neocloeon triangulifer TaxID=2078957 RepID=UPI00286F2E21|nr:SET and MYND domain-containing protein 4 [Neocloeon triangulifer]
MSASTPFSFLSFQEQVHNALNEADEAEFGLLQDNEQRICYVAKLLDAKGLQPNYRHGGAEKNSELALERRNEGNKAFQKGDFNTAQQVYTMSLLAANDPEAACLALANRSAALYNMKQYKFALKDIDELYTIGAYPKHLLHKVAERRARCFLALEQRVSARNAFRNTITALDDAKLDQDRKTKLRMDVQIMLVMLEKGVLVDAPLPLEETVKPPSLSGGVNPNFSCASDSLRFEWAGPTEGRMGRCRSAIRTGDTVLVETPIVSALLHERRHTHCWHCLERLATALPCPTCVEVAFCGTKCRDAALKTHHKWECDFLPTLRESKASVTCLLALRLASQTSIQKLRECVEAAEKRDVRVIGDEKYDSRDLSNFFTLVSHTERRSPRDLLQRSLMAHFLLGGLSKGGYFGEKSALGAELGADQALVGGALLQALQITQFNSHEVSELVSRNNDAEPKSLFIGGAVYPTLALLNHSCNPSVMRYHAPGGVVVVRAVRPIQPGEDVSENYGPLWTRESRDVRRQRLRDQYWFDCACEACDAEWPLFDEIPDDAIRLRCGGCGAAVKFGEEQIAATCLVCGHKTSVLASLAGVADTERKMELAKMRALDSSVEALDMFIQILEAYNKFLAPPPCKDFVLCQQAVRKCLLQHGNWFQG